MGVEGHHGAGFHAGRTTTDVLADLAGDHTRRAMEGTCRYCGVPWPCEPAVLLRYVRLLRAKVATMRASAHTLLDDWDDAVRALHEECVLSEASDAAFRKEHAAEKSAYAEALGIVTE